ncbi:hypothetical protein NEFER03_2012 [Nematocida sp. LUAm3]|nr:hypothetical protein NEFER03_2012 [Nematocida sp. LUAm3]KAI5174486.1 hypothetical protein NEFER02_0607 [Nematocida sp. LUAm2]KAI5179137.1 hypothetical protein NEFER01_2000 [Nematocida sp. LUAm1]
MNKKSEETTYTENEKELKKNLEAHLEDILLSNSIGQRKANRFFLAFENFHNHPMFSKILAHEVYRQMNENQQETLSNMPPEEQINGLERSIEEVKDFISFVDSQLPDEILFTRRQREHGRKNNEVSVEEEEEEEEEQELPYRNPTHLSIIEEDEFAHEEDLALPAPSSSGSPIENSHRTSDDAKSRNKKLKSGSGSGSKGSKEKSIISKMGNSFTTSIKSAKSSLSQAKSVAKNIKNSVKEKRIDIKHNINEKASSLTGTLAKTTGMSSHPKTKKLVKHIASAIIKSDKINFYRQLEDINRYMSDPSYSGVCIEILEDRRIDVDLVQLYKECCGLIRMKEQEKTYINYLRKRISTTSLEFNSDPEKMKEHLSNDMDYIMHVNSLPDGVLGRLKAIEVAVSKFEAEKNTKLPYVYSSELEIIDKYWDRFSLSDTTEFFELTPGSAENLKASIETCVKRSTTNAPGTAHFLSLEEQEYALKPIKEHLQNIITHSIKEVRQHLIKENEIAQLVERNPNIPLSAHSLETMADQSTLMNIYRVRRICQLPNDTTLESLAIEYHDSIKHLEEDAFREGLRRITPRVQDPDTISIASSSSPFVAEPLRISHGETFSVFTSKKAFYSIFLSIAGMFFFVNVLVALYSILYIFFIPNLVIGYAVGPLIFSIFNTMLISISLSFLGRRQIYEKKSLPKQVRKYSAGIVIVNLVLLACTISSVILLLQANHKELFNHLPLVGNI